MAFLPKSERIVSIIDFIQGEDVSNYSKSLFFFINKQAEDGKTTTIGTKGDLFILGDFLYQVSDTATVNQYKPEYTDSILFVNDKISSIQVSGRDSALPWLNSLLMQDLSAFQMISFSSDTINGGCIRDLQKLAAVRPDAGIIFSGDFRKIDGLLELFRPSLIISPVLYESDYGKLSGMSFLKILIANAGDTIMTLPLPAMPSLKHFALTDIGSKALITNDLMINNRQIEKIGFSGGGNLDLTLLRPLLNLKELVINGADALLNTEEINRHKKLEVLVLAGDDLKCDLSVIHLPRLRWLSVPSCVTQDEFNILLKNHPALEVLEILNNDTIISLKGLSGLSKLSCLTLMDTVTDLQSVKILKDLKYLSLPSKLLEDSLLRVELHQALPNTVIAANEGFCLGSGWLMLLVPLVLMIRFVYKKRTRHFSPE